MTTGEMIVIGGGLLLGYWLVAVFVPNLSRKDSSPDPEGPSYVEEPAVDPEEPFANKYEAPPPPKDESSYQHWFDVLEISEFAPREEISKAFKSQISQYHPDKVARMGRDIRQLAEERSKAINAAYDEAMRQRS